MIAEVQTAFAPVAIALGIAALFFGVPLLVGKTIARADHEESDWPTWLADLDVTDDGADTKRSPATEAAQRQSVGIANDQPDPAFIARTRRLLVDELAQRRAVQS